MTRELLQQALDFAEFCWREVSMNDYASNKLDLLLDALRAELAKPCDMGEMCLDCRVCPDAQPRLTDADIEADWKQAFLENTPKDFRHAFARAIERRVRGEAKA